MSHPTRRSALQFGGIALSMGVGGCLDHVATRPDTDETNRNASSDRATGLEENQSAPGDEGPPGTGTDTETNPTGNYEGNWDRDSPLPDDGSYAPSTRLTIRTTVEGGIRASLTLTELSESTVVYDQIHEFGGAGRLSLSDQFEPGEAYRFVVTVDGEQIFDREIYAYEGYELAISSPSTVEVHTQVEV